MARLYEILPRMQLLLIICAGLDNDPEKIGIYMLEMLAKFRNEGIVE